MKKNDSRNAFEVFMSIFTEVRAGEGGTVALFLLNAFIMMLLYYILKPVREGLIISGFGAVIKSYSSAAQALLFVAIVPLYGAFAARVNRAWLLSGLTLFFISNLLIFTFVLGTDFNIGIIFYIWLGIFNFMLISQFWAFANDLYTEDQGKRLFPIIGIGATAGALAGAWLTATTFEAMPDSTLLLLACIFLLLFICIIVWIHKRGKQDDVEETRKASGKLSKEGGFQLVLRNRYLLYIAAYILLLNLVNTVGEFILGSLFEQAKNEAIAAGVIAQENGSVFVRTLYAEFFGWVNLFGFLIQALLVGRFIKYLGVRGTIFIGPLVSLVTYGTSAIQPVLNIVRIVKIAENSNDYSTTNTVRATLFLPTSREIKYKAKAAIDTFFARGGDALQALVIFIGTRLAFALPAFALLNLVFIVIWLFVSGGIVREHKKFEMK
ncbi:MAG: Npt1/Npt2 family nucleotide transporter [Acidobacteriota bacterium]